MPTRDVTDEALWGAPLQAAPALLDTMLERKEPGVHLWAPTPVALDARRSLPVHAGFAGEAGELLRMGFAERAFVVAVDEETGHTRAMRVGGGPAPERVAPPPGFEGGLGPTSRSTAAQVARCVLWDGSSNAPAWPPGRYRMVAITADRISQPVRVQVIRSTTTVDPAVRAAAAAAETSQVWPPPDPAGGLPRYDATHSLTAPAQPGLVLGAERVVRVRDGVSCPLHGAVHASARGAHRAAHGAIVPVTLVVTGTERPGPVVIPMRIPSFDRDLARADGGITARFMVDLFRLAPVGAAPQTYFVYAFTADGHAGPQAIAVVAG